MRRGQERRLYVKLGEEALRRDHDQRVAGFAGDVRAVQLALVDRGHRRRLAGIVRQVQPQLRIRCHCGGHRRRSTGHDYLAREAPSWCDQVRLIDATPVPCGASRETVKRSELAGWAGYGYCAAHSRWYWGLKLYLITTPDGMPVAWCLASPAIGEREVAAGLLAHAARTGALRPGLTLIGDKGFAGRNFEDLVTSGFGLRLVRPDRRDEAPRH